MHRRLNLNRSAPRSNQADAIAPSSEIRTSAPAVPIPAQEQLRVQPEPRRANSVQCKAPEATPFVREPPKNARASPFNFNRLTKADRREKTPLLRVPDSVRQAQLGRRTPIRELGPVKRPPRLPSREYIEHQLPKKRKLDQVQQPPDPGPSRPLNRSHEPTSSSDPNDLPSVPIAPPQQLGMHTNPLPIRERNTTSTPSPQKPQLPSRMGSIRTFKANTNPCPPHVPVEPQAQVPRLEQHSPLPLPSATQISRDYKLTKDELDEPVTKPEPSHPQNFVVRGLDRLEASATNETYRCEWDRGRCPAPPFASDKQLSEHVLAHLAPEYSNNSTCLWASCLQPPLPKQALTSHVLDAHLPSTQPPQKSPSQSDAIASPSKIGPSLTESLTAPAPPQGVPQIQQQPPAIVPEPRENTLVENILQALMPRLDRMEDAACERYAKLESRLGVMEDAIKVDRKQKQKAEEEVRKFTEEVRKTAEEERKKMKEERKKTEEERQKAEEERQKAEEEERQKTKEERQKTEEERKKAEDEKDSLVNGQKRIVQYLALLAQRMAEMKKATAETGEVLGIVDATAASVGKVDVQMPPDGSLDVNILDPSKSVSPSSISAFGSDITSKPGLRGWQPQNEDQPYEDIGQPDSEPRSRQRGIIQRLESMEKTQQEIAEWCKKMKDREVPLHLEGRNVDGEQERAAEKVLQQSSGLPPARPAATSSPSPAPQSCLYNESKTRLMALQPQTRSLSTLSSIDSTATRDSIDIHISDAPPISSSSTSTLFSTADGPAPTSTTTSAEAGHPVISVHDENGADGPLVRIHATGNAGIRLLELAKTLLGGEKAEEQEKSSEDAIVQRVAEEAVAEEAVTEQGGKAGMEAVAMDVDVFDSRPNVQLDPRAKSMRKFYTEKTLVGDTSAVVLKDAAITGSGATPTHPILTDVLLSGSIHSPEDATTFLLQSSQSHTPSTSGSTLANEIAPPASLKIKIKPIQHRAVNESTPTRIGSSTTSGSTGAVPAALPTTISAISAASVSDPKSRLDPSSKPDSPTIGFGTGMKFGFSPVRDWTNSSPNAKSLSFDFSHGPISSTPTRHGRLLRSSSRPQSGTSDPLDGRVSIAPRTPTRTPRTRSSLAESRKAKVEEVVHSQEMNASPVMNVAQRAVQGLLDVQAVTPQRLFSLDPGVALPITPNASTSAKASEGSLVIRLPPSAPRDKNISKAPLGPSRTVPKDDEFDDGPAKQLAERAVKGLLHAQAVSPQKPYSVDLDMTSSAQKSTVVLMDPPISTPRRAATPMVSPFLSRSYTLPTPLEGTIAALRQQTLGHPYVYAGAGLGSPRTDSREAKQEEIETTVMQVDEETVARMPDDTDEVDSGQSEKSVSVEATAIQVDESMEESMIKESQPANEECEGHDELMEDVTAEQISMNVQTPSDLQTALPSAPITALPLPTLEALEKSAEPGPEYGISLSDSMPSVGPEVAFSHTLTTTSRPQPQFSPQHDLQPLSPVASTAGPPPSSPAAELTEPLTPENSPLISHSVPTISTEPKDTTPPPLVPTSPILPTETVVALSMSQTTTTTVDEQQVDSLLMDDVIPSSPVKHSVLEPDRQEPSNGLESEVSSSEAQDTTPRCSPIIPSSCSPPEIRPHVFDLDDVLDKSGTVTEHFKPIQAGEAAIELASSPLVKDSEDQQSLQYDENIVRTPSLVSPRIRSASPNVTSIPPVDEDLLRPEIILQVKAELDILPDQPLTQTQTNSAENGPSLKTEPEYIYISDSSPQKPPVKKTVVAKQSQKKRIVRALSVISISSDDDDDDDHNRQKVSPPQLNRENHPSKLSEIYALQIERVDPIHTRPSPRDRIAAEVEPEQLSIERSTVDATQQRPAPNEAFSAASILTKELSPMSELSDETPPPDNDTDRVLNKAGNSSFDFKKYSAKLDADDDIPIIPLKKKRKVSGLSEAATEDGSVADSENGIGVKKKSLLVMAKKGRSAAITRIKKRKNPHEELGSDDEEPPLKKANLRKDIKASESKENKKGLLPTAKVKGKTREQPARSPKKTKVEVPQTPTRFPRGQHKAPTVKWPTIQNPDYDQFIKCDLCGSWYHLGCVGVGPNDPSMDDGEFYTCPPCAVDVLVNDSESPHKVKPDFDDLQSNSCSRPKCQRPKKKNVLPEEETFVIESFVGRHRKVVGGKGVSVYYLVKWHGYPHNECTWEELNAMRLANSSVLVQTFEQAARKEELDLDNPSDEYSLLREAADAGWRSNDGVFVKPE